MNQRTTELYQQALEFAYDNVPKEDWNSGVFHPIVSGKFAELIVKECMDIAKRTGDRFGSWNPDVVVGGQGGTFCVYHNIKNWFGVEE